MALGEALNDVMAGILALEVILHYVLQAGLALHDVIPLGRDPLAAQVLHEMPDAPARIILAHSAAARAAVGASNRNVTAGAATGALAISQVAANAANEEWIDQNSALHRLAEVAERKQVGTSIIYL